MREMAKHRKAVVLAGCAVAVAGVLSGCGSGAGSSAGAKADTHAMTPVAASSSASSSTPTGAVAKTSASSSTPTTALAKTSASSSTPTTAVAKTSAPSSTTSRSSATPAAAEFLTANQLPDAKAYGWSRQYVTQVHIEEPLEPICGNALGTELNTDAWQALYPSTDAQDSAVETVHTYKSAAYAASRYQASYPTCSGLIATAANGFAWHSAAGAPHVLFVTVGKQIATLTVTVPTRDYDPSLDAKLLRAMAAHLPGS